jgi:hypothetical protein
MRHMGFLLVLFAVVAIVVATTMTLEPGATCASHRASTPSATFRMQRMLELRFSATPGEEPEVELALV